MKLKKRQPAPSRPTVNELLRPDLESYSTTALIAELARRGVFQSVPELESDAPKATTGGEEADVEPEEGGPARPWPGHPALHRVGNRR